MAHLGIQLGTSGVTWTELHRAASRIDELGYDTLWVPDHIVAREAPETSRFDAWQVLAALGGATRRVRLGTLVSPVTFRHPVLLVKAAVTLDHATGGRAILGLGAGSMHEDHVPFSLELGTAHQRAQRLEEAAAVARSLLDERETTFQGRHYRLDRARIAPKPVQRVLPLMVAGAGRHTLRAAAAHAQMWNVIASPERFGDAITRLRAACAAIRRDPTEIIATASFRLTIGTRARLEERAAELRRKAPAWADDPYRFSGTPDEIAEQLERFVSAGAGGFIVQMPAPYDLETLQLLATTVAPRLGGSGGKHRDAR